SLHRRPGGDAPEQRHLERSVLPAPAFVDVFRPQVQTPALVETALQVLFGFERRDVLVDRRERSQIQAVGNFFIAWTVAVVFDEPRHEVQNLFLPLGNRHCTSSLFSLLILHFIVGEEKGKVKNKSSLRLSTQPRGWRRPVACDLAGYQPAPQAHAVSTSIRKCATPLRARS